MLLILLGTLILGYISFMELASSTAYRQRDKIARKLAYILLIVGIITEIIILINIS